MLWFNFFLGLNFLFLCLKLIIMHYGTPKQRKNKIETKQKIEPKHIHCKYNTFYNQKFIFFSKIWIITNNSWKWQTKSLNIEYYYCHSWCNNKLSISSIMWSSAVAALYCREIYKCCILVWLYCDYFFGQACYSSETLTTQTFLFLCLCNKTESWSQVFIAEMAETGDKYHDMTYNTFKSFPGMGQSMNNNWRDSNNFCIFPLHKLLIVAWMGKHLLTYSSLHLGS